MITCPKCQKKTLRTQTRAWRVRGVCAGCAFQTDWVIVPALMTPRVYLLLRCRQLAVAYRRVRVGVAT